MNRTGEVETLFVANGRSLPRGERPIPITRIGIDRFERVVARCKKTPAFAAETYPVPSECGRMNAGWFGSFRTTYCLTVGYSAATGRAMLRTPPAWPSQPRAPGWGTGRPRARRGAPRLGGRNDAVEWLLVADSLGSLGSTARSTPIASGPRRSSGGRTFRPSPPRTCRCRHSRRSLPPMLLPHTRAPPTPGRYHSSSHDLLIRRPQPVLGARGSSYA